MPVLMCPRCGEERLVERTDDGRIYCAVCGQLSEVPDEKE